MIAGHLSNFYFDMGEKYGMKFVRAQANKVPDLAEFKDTAKPHFLIYLVRRASRDPLATGAVGCRKTDDDRLPCLPPAPNARS